jgi:subtilisin family serine protease
MACGGIHWCNATMDDSRAPRFPLSRRRLMQGLAGLSTAALLSDPVTVAGDPNGGGNGSPPGGNGANSGTDSTTITLITGQTIHISEAGNDRQYTVTSDREAEHLQFIEVTDDPTLPDGTYAIPATADVELYSPLFFNLDLLIEQGFTDAQTDVMPVIVTTATGPSAMARSLGSINGFTATSTLSSIDAVAGTVAKDTAAATTQNVAQTVRVEQVYLDATFEPVLNQSAPAVNAQAARKQFDVDGTDMAIAVIDTGIDADHPDFGDRVIYQKDFSGDGIDDAFGHGTHVAGIAAGAGTVSEGKYVGMAPESSLLNIKVLGDSGFGTLSDIVKGIEHAVKKDADIISMSLGGPVQENGPLSMAANHAVEQGVVTVVAAGNAGGYMTIGSPGIAKQVITVGATNTDGQIAQFSSSGPTPFDYRVKPEVVAPGVDITSTGSHASGTFPYVEYSGTSMSTPHVSGLAALLLDHNPDQSPQAIKDTLVATADPIADTNVFKQGSGEVDAVAALDADLRIHDAVRSFGLYSEPTTDSTTITLENTGTEPLTLDAAATGVNVQEGTSLDEHISVTPQSVDIAPGATHDLTLEIETNRNFGYNSGVLTLTTSDDTTYRSIFGYVAGTEVTVEKRPAENSGNITLDPLIMWSHDGRVRRYAFAPFIRDNQTSFVIFDYEGDFTLWSSGTLQPSGDQFYGPPVYTIKPIHIDGEHTHFTLDERATVPRTLDTSQVSQHTPLATLTFGSRLYGTPANGPPITLSASVFGDSGNRTVYFSPLPQSTPTNISTRYLMVPKKQGGKYPLDSPVVYDLFYGALGVPDEKTVITVDPDELAAETFDYYRNYNNQLYSIASFLVPADEQHFPASGAAASPLGISKTRVNQTWYRTDEASYQETWFDGFRSTTDWQFQRSTPLVPEAGATYHKDFNREPLGTQIAAWDLDNGTLKLTGQWYTDQATPSFLTYTTDSPSPNEYSVAVDGEVVASGSGLRPSFQATADGITDGSVIEASLQGNSLTGTARQTTTVTDYTVVAGSGADRPPQITSVDVAGLTTLNEVPVGQIIVFVEITTRAASLPSFTAYYAESGTVSATPFENKEDWRTADIVYNGGTLYGIRLDTAGLVGPLDLAIAASDSANNQVQHTTFEAITATEGTAVAAPIDIKPNTINATSSEQVPVVIKQTDALDTTAIDTDTLRFGSPAAVAGNGGAPSISVNHLNNGNLTALFAASETGLTCGATPAAGQLAGTLTDGTPISGANVIAQVLCSGATVPTS